METAKTDQDPKLFDDGEYFIENSFGEVPALDAQQMKDLADELHDKGEYSLALFYWAKAERQAKLAKFIGTL